MVRYLNQTCLWEGPTRERIKLHALGKEQQSFKVAGRGSYLVFYGLHRDSLYLDKIILRQNYKVGCLILSRVTLSEADIL